SGISRVIVSFQLNDALTEAPMFDPAATPVDLPALAANPIENDVPDVYWVIELGVEGADLSRFICGGALIEALTPAVHQPRSSTQFGAPGLRRNSPGSFGLLTGETCPASS